LNVLTNFWVFLILDFLSQFGIFNFYLIFDVLRNSRCVAVLFEILETIWFIADRRHLVVVDILLFKVISNLAMDINKPISCLPGVSTLRILEDFFLCNFCYSDIIKLSPFILESIKNKRIIMTTVGISIMYANRMKMIFVFWHIICCICFFYLLFESSDFGFHLINLRA